APRGSCGPASAPGSPGNPRRPRAPAVPRRLRARGDSRRLAGVAGRGLAPDPEKGRSAPGPGTSGPRGRRGPPGDPGSKGTRTPGRRGERWFVALGGVPPAREEDAMASSPLDDRTVTALVAEA